MNNTKKQKTLFIVSLLYVVIGMYFIYTGKIFNLYTNYSLDINSKIVNLYNNDNKNNEWYIDKAREMRKITSKDTIKMYDDTLWDSRKGNTKFSKIERSIFVVKKGTNYTDYVSNYLKLEDSKLVKGNIFLVSVGKNKYEVYGDTDFLSKVLNVSNGEVLEKSKEDIYDEVNKYNISGKNIEKELNNLRDDYKSKRYEELVLIGIFLVGYAVAIINIFKNLKYHFFREEKTNES